MYPNDDYCDDSDIFGGTFGDYPDDYENDYDDEGDGYDDDYPMEDQHLDGMYEE
jgi:hypothetical protein